MLYCRKKRNIMRNLTRFLYVLILIWHIKTCVLQPVIVACVQKFVEIVWLAVKNQVHDVSPQKLQQLLDDLMKWLEKRRRENGNLEASEPLDRRFFFSTFHSSSFWGWIISSCFNFTLFSLLCCCLDFCWAQPLVPVACSTAHSAMTLELRQEIP